MKTHEEIEQEIDGLFKTTPWASHPRFPVEDWQYEVRNNDTRQGYATWLYNKLAEDDGEIWEGFFCAQLAAMSGRVQNLRTTALNVGSMSRRIGTYESRTV